MPVRVEALKICMGAHHIADVARLEAPDFEDLLVNSRNFDSFQAERNAILADHQVSVHALCRIIPEDRVSLGLQPASICTGMKQCPTVR